MPKSTKSEDVQAISKIAGALAELSPDGQQDVLTLLRAMGVERWRPELRRGWPRR